MKKNIINYVMYVLIFLVVIVGLVFLLSSSNNDNPSDNNDEKPQEELVVTNNVLNINVNETIKIDAKVSNNSNAVINYLSTNTNVAIVSSDGIVTGVSNGTAYIIINYESYTKQCIVNVSGGVEIVSVSLPKGELLMKVGDSYKLDVTTEPVDIDKSKLSYLVNDKSIVTVNQEGLVTAQREGVAALRVTAKENINADILVRVVNNPNVISNIVSMPEKITTLKNITLKIDEEKKIVYVVEPEDAYMENVSWSSSDTNIVSVSDGNVKGLSEGSATVTMKTVNGIELVTNVSVKPQVIEVSSINITSNTNVSLKVGETSQVTYEIKPENATDKKVTFQSTNTNVASVNEQGLITANGSGSATIKVISSNGLKVSSVNVTVTKKNDGDSVSQSCNGETRVGKTNSELLSSPSDAGFDKCKRVSQNLVPYIGGVNYGQDGFYVMHVGDTLTVNVKLPTLCGKIDQLTRTNHDGQGGWSEYVSQTSSPKVNRNDSSTYVSGVDGYTWTITAKKKGCLTLSQTAQFDVTSPSGKRGNMKSMIRLKVRIVD